MQKFDPQAFLAVLEEDAIELGIDFKFFFDKIRLKFDSHRPDKTKCLRLMQLVGAEISLRKETIKHVENCWFCSAMVKCSWLESTSEEDRDEICDYVMKACHITGEHYEAKLVDESAAEAGDPHLSHPEMVCFNSISQLRRNHRVICKQCDLHMLILETMPLPDLS